MARKRFRPAALCGSSNKAKAIVAYNIQANMEVKASVCYYTICFGVEIKITEAEAKKLGNLAYKK